jgi:hypothetical protein
MIGRELYKCSTSGVLQRCIPIPEGQLIRDIHAGICGHHAVPRTLMGNAFRPRLLLAHGGHRCQRGYVHQ